MATRALGGALALIIAATAAAPGIGAPRHDPVAGDSGLHASAAKKKKKRKKKVVCKQGQVRVNLGGRVTCKSVKAALPAPKESDARLVLLQDALAMNLGHGHDKRGRPAPSPAQMFRRLGPGALEAAKKVMPRAVALVGNPAALAASHARGMASGVCANLKSINDDTLTSSEKSGGYQLDVKATVDSLAVAITGPGENGQSKRITIDLDWCKLLESVDVPACPNSKGELDATGSIKVTIGIELIEDGKVVEGFTETIEDTTQMHGQVADDAKLDYVDIHDSQSMKQSSPGSGILVGASSVSSSFIRTTRVNMRAQPEQYQADETKITADASLGGIAGALVGGSFRQNALARLKQASDRIFADVVKRAIERYRSRESAWLQPNICAKLEFDPKSDSLKLKKGDHGQFTGKNIAIRDNGDPGGRWTLTGSENATVTPANADGGSSTFSYDVQDSGAGKFVTATFHVTSKAGVAEGTWKQPTGDNINTITGTFSGHDDDQGSIVDWTGTATFKRADDSKGVGGTFVLESGEATFTASGAVIGADCQQTGTQTVALSPSSVWAIENEAPPFQYQIIAPPGYPGKMDVTWTGCADPNANGTQGDRSLPTPLQSGGPPYSADTQTTTDPFMYEGSANGTGSEPSETIHWTWSFTAAP